MSELLDFVIAASGGLERWMGANSMSIKASIGGGIWRAKGKAGALAAVEIDVKCHEQQVSYRPFTALDRKSVYRPEWVAVETLDEKVLESRKCPRDAFAGHVDETQWDSLHLAYFSGYAIWNYMNTPFLFTMPGFLEEEIEPWHEDGEEWRRLKVTFPSYVGTHCPKQIFYFDIRGNLKRHDYTPEVIGSRPAANYALDPREFSGLTIPTKRRVYPLRPDGQPIREVVAVAIDIADIKVS